MAGKRKKSEKEDRAEEDMDIREKTAEESEQPGHTASTPETDEGKNTDEGKEEKTVPLDRFLRLQAEFDNYRKRVEKEKKEIIEYSSEVIITKLLDVLDNFERAFTALDNGGSLEEFRDGMERVHRLFRETLEKEGLSEITEVERFDPYLHEAMMQEINEDVEDETVTEVFQKGYRLGSKVIRPAKVKVSRKE